jgi:hypothetical protein
MKLDALTVELRPRSGWEAMELGSALVRRHAAAIWVPWLIVTLPVLALLCAGAWALGSVMLAWLAMWWLRPLFDRIPVYVLSRAVFGTAPGYAQTVRAQFRWGWRPMRGHLTWRRFSPLRAVTLPIDLLEGADPKLLAERRRIIGTGASGHAVQLTLMCVHFIYAVQLSLILLVLLFVPNEKLPQFMQDVMELMGGRPPEWAILLLVIVDYAATTVIEPFYVGGGFGLYLNRRTQLEAWDVEIAFRRMRKRIEAGSLGALLLLTACWPLAASAQSFALQQSSPPTVQAQPAKDGENTADPAASKKTPAQTPIKTPEELAEEALGGPVQPQKDPEPGSQQPPQQTPPQAKADASANEDEDGKPARELASIFGEGTAAHRDFGRAVERAYQDKDLRPKRREAVWEKRNRAQRQSGSAAQPELEGFAAVLAFIGEYGLWLLFGAVVLTLILTAKRWLPWLRAMVMPGDPEPVPIEVQSVDKAEPLPPDIASSARRLWREGQPRRALALLYRASVEAMLARAGTHLPPGATEAECLRVARRMPDADDRTVFQQMVRVWQYAAYGQRLPEERDFDAMLDALVQRFGWRT